MQNVEIGFANADGGTIVVGLGAGRVDGTDADARRRNGQMQAGIDFTDPPVRATSDLVPCVNDRGGRDHLLVIHIESSEVVHANRRDEVFLRVGDENRRLTYRQRQKLLTIVARQSSRAVTSSDRRSMSSTMNSWVIMRAPHGTVTHPGSCGPAGSSPETG